MSATAEHWAARPRLFFSLGIPQAAWLAVFFVFPLLFVFGLSFSEKRGILENTLNWNLDNYRLALEPLYLQIFGKSFAIAAAATAICLVVGYPVALAIAFAPPRWKTPLLVAVVLPFWINILIRTYALIAVFRSSGYLNDGLEWLWLAGDFALELFGGDLGESFTRPTLLYTNFAVTMGIVYAFLPFMILPLYASLERFDRSYLEASMDLGGGHARAIFSILLPLTAPGVLSGVIIVFVPALGAFFIADMLGGADSQLIGNVIERQFKSANNYPFGAALSFLLMYVTFGAIALRAALAGREKSAAADRPQK